MSRHFGDASGHLHDLSRRFVSPLPRKSSTKRSRNIKEILASEASPQTDKSMNWVSLRSDLETKPKFNDSVIPAWKPGSSAMDGTLIARKYLLLDSRFRGNDGRVTDENPWFRLGRVRYRKNKKIPKNRCLRKEHPVWILLLRANMFIGVSGALTDIPGAVGYGNVEAPMVEADICLSRGICLRFHPWAFCCYQIW
uniref:Uncharacterized protein n=1 Tax=Candidatus Kentrum sp. LPFa TaxID=2126335 RepID=A0A450VR00_9GAMM|nr:MAG: hypothetical protein BECKLPF1236B_GA0070989_100227 [Candidatus Kentron sp. LPFa]